MTHSAFRTAQIMPINSQIIPTAKFLSPPTVFHVHSPVHRLPPVSGKHRKGLVVKASSASKEAVGGAVAGLERCFGAPPLADSPSASAAYVPVMKVGDEFGASRAVVTLEKSKAATSKQTVTKPPDVWLSLVGNYLLEIGFLEKYGIKKQDKFTEMNKLHSNESNASVY